MKQTAVPTSLTDHLTRSWPERKLVSHHVLVPARQLGPNPDALLAQIESDVAVQVAVGLTHDQWVMLTSSGPQWWILVEAFGSAEAMTRQAWRAWDRDREPAATVPDTAMLKCEISGYAVPTFLGEDLWPFTSGADEAAPLCEEGT